MISDNLKITEITNEPFKFSIPNLQIIKESIDPENPDAPIKFEGQASTTEISTSGHKMNPPAIQKMKETCQKLPMFWDHDESRRAASIIDYKNTNENEFWPIGETAEIVGNPILDAPILQVIRDLNDPNCEVGMSIGGIIAKARFVEDMDTGEYWFEIDDIDLYEVSLTTIPALDSTKGKTKILNSCKGSICSQIVAEMRQNSKDSSFNEAISRIEQRKGGSKIKQHLEVDSMDEETKNLIETQNKKIEDLTQGMGTITDYIKQDIEAKKLEQAAAAEKEAKDAIKAELKQEVVQEFTEEILPKLAETTNKAFEQKIAALTGTRTHVQASTQGAGEHPPKTPGDIVPITQTPQIDNAKSSIALNQKCVVMGQTTEGYMPSEYLEGKANQ